MRLTAKSTSVHVVTLLLVQSACTNEISARSQWVEAFDKASLNESETYYLQNETETGWENSGKSVRN